MKEAPAVYGSEGIDFDSDNDFDLSNPAHEPRRFRDCYPPRSHIIPVDDYGDDYGGR